MYNRHCDEKDKVKLKPGKTDNEQLHFLIKNRIENMDRNSNIYRNYIVFKNLIEDTISKGLDIGMIFEGVKLLEVVEIILDKER